MDFREIIDLFLHLDDHLRQVVENYRSGVYGILFAIIFAETGLVITPILPGDSLLFACGALAADGTLSLPFLLLLLSAAAIIGDAVNYSVGKWLGMRVFREDSRIFKPAYLERTEAFYRKYGARTIVLARFVPIIRTFAPFVAGASRMEYRRFGLYNILGGILWVCSMTLAGYLFGNIPVVEENFTLVVLGIIAISLLPVAVEWWRGRKARKSVSKPEERANGLDPR
jgi:membrane-associated protein